MADYISGFINNLGNEYTPVLLAFILGYIVGEKLGGVGMRILVGLLFAVVTLLIVSFIDNVMPATINIPLNVKVIFVLILLVALFYYLTKN